MDRPPARDPALRRERSISEDGEAKGGADAAADHPPPAAHPTLSSQRSRSHSPTGRRRESVFDGGGGARKGGAENIKVCVRLRPMAAGEKGEPCVQIDEEKRTATILGQDYTGTGRAFSFDRAFVPTASQKEVRE